MKEFLLFLWERYALRCRNVGYGRCRWNCPQWPTWPKQRILLDEGMCRSCYWDDYVIHYK